MCELCRELLKAAQAAIQAQLKAVARLQEAVQHGRTDRIAELSWAVGQADSTREQAVAAYRSHAAMHEGQATLKAGGAA